jgi:hypothetical protein
MADGGIGTFDRLARIGCSILMALVAGIGSLRGFPWSRTLGIAVFAIQVPAFQTPWFFYAVWLGVPKHHFGLDGRRDSWHKSDSPWHAVVGRSASART